MKANFKYVDNISESFSFNQDQNGGFSYTHQVSVDCSGAATGMITIAKSIARGLSESNGLTGFIGNYDQNIKKTYEEKTDKIRNSYSFTENGFYNGSLSSNYFSKITHSYSLNTDGNVTVKEDGEIVGIGDLAMRFSRAKSAYATLLSSSKDRCKTIFDSYLKESNRHTLNENVRVSVTTNEEEASGKILYSVEYSNDISLNDTYIHSYTISKTKRGRFYDVSQSGTIKGTGALSSRFSNALGALSDILVSLKSNVDSEIAIGIDEDIHLVSKSRKENEHDGVISYSETYTNDPDFSSLKGIKKISTMVTNNRSLLLKSKAGIVGHKEIIQSLNLNSMSSREASVEILGKKESDYKEDILRAAMSAINSNAPSTADAYIDSCETTYNPFSRKFTARVVWFFITSIADARGREKI